MRRLAWLTDIHLNFVTPRHVDTLVCAVHTAGAEAVLLTGDVAEAPELVAHLESLDARLERPLYFVLGNHDFYRGSIAAVRATVAGLCARSSSLCWLSRAGMIELTLGPACWATTAGPTGGRATTRSPTSSSTTIS
jgi:hypothetical protein